MSIVLLGSTSGSCTLQEQAVAGTSVLTLPVGTGTVVANNVNSAIVSGTAVASTSGTSIDFTSIPSWVKRITVMFNAVSTNGSSNIIVQLGTSSGVTTSGYTGRYQFYSGSSSSAGGSLSTGFLTIQNAASSLCYGTFVFFNINGNTWLCSSNMTDDGGNYNIQCNGIIALASTLDRVRITTVSGTPTFDNGTLNILYE